MPQSAAHGSGYRPRRSGTAPGWAVALLALGLLGLFLLPLWPLVFALEVVPGIIALFGLGWVLVGCRLWFRSSAADGPSPLR